MIYENACRIRSLQHFLLLFLPVVFILVLKELGKCILGVGAYCMESMDTGVSPNAQDRFPLIHLGRVLVFVAAQRRNASFFFVSFSVGYVLPMWDSNM